MKKWNTVSSRRTARLLLLAFALPFFLFNLTSAINITSLTTAIDKAAEKKGNTTNQISFLKTLETLLTSPDFTNSQHTQTFSELEQYITNKIKSLQTQPSQGITKKSDGTNYISIANVDSQKIKDTLLQRHNQERTSKGATPYSYHSDLEKTAQTRADLLNAESRTSNTHQRNATDGYYSYDSITERFETLGIAFPVAGWGRASFSESVGWWYYSCKSSDCTNELLTQLQTTRDFFMSEKNSNGSHYKAITMGHFSQMGIGVSIDSARKRYYLVIHYGMDVLEA